MEGASNVLSTVLTDVGTTVSEGIDIITGNPILAVFVGFGVVIGAMKVFKSAKKSVNVPEYTSLLLSR